MPGVPSLREGLACAVVSATREAGLLHFNSIILLAQTGIRHGATGVYYPSRQRGGIMAARSAGAADWDARDRHPGPWSTSRVRGWVPSGPRRSRLCPGPERDDRVPLVG